MEKTTKYPKAPLESKEKIDFSNTHVVVEEKLVGEMMTSTDVLDNIKNIRDASSTTDLDNQNNKRKL